jgi:hypothetical protein
MHSLRIHMHVLEHLHALTKQNPEKQEKKVLELRRYMEGMAQESRQATPSFPPFFFLRQKHRIWLLRKTEYKEAVYTKTLNTTANNKKAPKVFFFLWMLAQIAVILAAATQGPMNRKQTWTGVACRCHHRYSHTRR